MNQNKVIIPQNKNQLSNIDEKNWVHFRLKPGEKIFKRINNGIIQY